MKIRGQQYAIFDPLRCFSQKKSLTGIVHSRCTFVLMGAIFIVSYCVVLVPRDCYELHVPAVLGKSRCCRGIDWDIKHLRSRKTKVKIRSVCAIFGRNAV